MGGHMSITRRGAPGFTTFEGSEQMELVGDASFIAGTNLDRLPLGYAGMQSTVITQNPVLEVELPYHTPERFIPAKISEPNSILGTRYHYANILNSMDQVTNLGGPYFVDYTAAGDDFSLFWYTGVPIMYAASSDPTP